MEKSLTKISTEELLQNSFLNLASKMPINKITVSMLCKNCGIRRETFYLHYKSIYNLLYSCLRKYIFYCQQSFFRKEITYVESWTVTLTEIIKMEAFMKNVLNINYSFTNDHYSLPDVYEEDTIKIMKEDRDKYYAFKLSPHQDFIMDLYYRGCISIVNKWIVSGFDKSPIDLAYEIVSAMPEELNFLLSKEEIEEIKNRFK